jgi:hypothetical protein
VRLATGVRVARGKFAAIDAEDGSAMVNGN